MIKRINLIISLILILCLCGCATDMNKNMIIRSTAENYGDTGGLNLPLATDGTKLNILTESLYQDIGDKLVIRELSERTGIDFNVKSTPASKIKEQARVLLSSNDIPDIIYGDFELSEINSMGSKGIFAPLNKYLNELPNFRKNFVTSFEYGDVFKKYSAKDGNLYTYPIFGINRSISDGMIYRKDIFKKHNIPLWHNESEFYNSLKKLKKIYPESTPYISKDNKNIFEKWSVSFGIKFPGMFYDKEKNMWYYSATDKRFKDMLDFIRKLCKEGLIDSEFNSSNENSWSAKMKDEKRTFVTYCELGYMDLFTEEVRKDIPTYELAFAPPPGPTGEVISDEKTMIGPVVSNGANKLLAFKLLDYLSSPSGAELMSLGVINKTFIYNNDNEVEYLGFSKGTVVTKKMLSERYGMFIKGFYQTSALRSPHMKYSEREKEAFSYSIKNENTSIVKEPDLTSEEREKTEAILSNLNERAYSFAHEYVLTNEDTEKIYNEFINICNMYGLNELIKMYNKI